ncbi:uncharacterized protein N7503_008882 [Penicillium pulvis]|uniref:uncharacterized protein n=1 Tax=Penicillium pulvis TaxID=1562058 RepID=UPI00254851EA|nr:uncharacterized protein N7503_008882 [Penicillium pulvis]KAJ5792904.1 hypothetical protein N7503_008882 [Penicillium pulvis]
MATCHSLGEGQKCSSHVYELIKARIFAEFKDSSNLHYLEDIGFLGPAKTEELQCDTYYSEDMHFAKCCTLRARLPMELYSKNPHIGRARISGNSEATE